MTKIRRYQQNKVISKISLDSNFSFTNYALLCALALLHRATVLNKFSDTRILAKMPLISQGNEFY